MTNEEKFILWLRSNPSPEKKKRAIEMINILLKLESSLQGS